MSDDQELTAEIAAKLFGGKANDPQAEVPPAGLDAEPEQPRVEALPERTPEQSQDQTLLNVLRPEAKRARDLALIRMLHGPPGG